MCCERWKDADEEGHEIALELPDVALAFQASQQAIPEEPTKGVCHRQVLERVLGAID